jgi:hypothetical protein
MVPLLLQPGTPLCANRRFYRRSYGYSYGVYLGACYKILLPGPDKKFAVSLQDPNKKKCRRRRANLAAHPNVTITTTKKICRRHAASAFDAGRWIDAGFAYTVL